MKRMYLLIHKHCLRFFSLVLSILRCYKDVKYVESPNVFWFQLLFKTWL